MKRNIAIIAFAAITSLTVLAQPLLAGNAGASPAACANHVVQACNGSKHPESCTSAGLSACEKHFKTKSDTSGLVIKLKEMNNGRYKAIIIDPTSDDERDEDRNSDDTDRGSDRDTEDRSKADSERDETGGRAERDEDRNSNDTGRRS